jgi:hypothetical protein
MDDQTSWTKPGHTTCNGHVFEPLKKEFKGHNFTSYNHLQDTEIWIGTKQTLCFMVNMTEPAFIASPIGQ